MSVGRPAVLKLALPAGDLRAPVAARLAEAGLGVPGYAEGSRSYRLRLEGHDGVVVRVFREKDIPIQIALGNYDLGICGLAWVAEFLARYPREAIVKVRDLGIGASRLYLAAAAGSFASLQEAAAVWGLRIASEYANLAEALAMAARFPAYRIIPVWGAAEAYPPEDADLALVAAATAESLRQEGLQPLHILLEDSAWLIAHRGRLQEKDLSAVLEPLLALCRGVRAGRGELNLPPPQYVGAGRSGAGAFVNDKVRFAFPDGHLQVAAAEALAGAGLAFDGYGAAVFLRRPRSPLLGLEAKVIRPQDMPQMVASGSFDLAITGRDCLRDHLYRFPSSPVEEMVDLGRGRFDLCAVVSQDLAAEGLNEALEQWRRQGKALVRVASEFVNIADHYARSHHFWRYQVMPIAGASEGFVPEDADLLIEGTETGRTLAENNLKAIDLLFRSSLCLIGRREKGPGGNKEKILRRVVALLQEGARTLA